MNYVNDRRKHQMMIEAYQRSRNEKYVDQRQLRTRCWDGPALKVQTSKLTMYQPSLEYTLASIWNALDPRDRLIATLELFKFTMKE